MSPRMSMLCLLVLCIAGGFGASALSADDWVSKAREADQFQNRHVINVGNACDIKLFEGGIDTSADGTGGVPVTSLTMAARVGAIIDVCATGSESATLSANDLFKSSAVWKVELLYGYIQGRGLQSVVANKGQRCVSIFLVPVGNTAEADTMYTATVNACPALDIKITGTTSDEELTKDDAALRVLGDYNPASVLPAEIALVYSPTCGLDQTEGADGVTEGNGESSGTPSPDEGADGVTEGNGESSGTPSPDEGADGVTEGNGESATPSPDEGADGVTEGNGESAAPSPTEGADGVYEGNGESATPSPTEGADGIYEGNGESATPSTTEGADGIYEGNGESATPSATEGADGTYEGAGESATPSPTEGADGTYEGAGESATPSPTEGADGTLEGAGESSGAPTPLTRRLLSEDALSEGDASSGPSDAKWMYSGAHSKLVSTVVNGDALDPVESGAYATEGGEGAARRLLSGARYLLAELPKAQNMASAKDSPMQLVSNMWYKLIVHTVRAPLATYFAAPELFKASNTRLIEDAAGGAVFNEPLSIELYPGVGYMTLYIKPLTAGNYGISNFDDPSATGAITGSVEVVAAEADLADSSTLKTEAVTYLPCQTAGPVQSAGTPTPATSSATRSIVSTMLSVVAVLAIAL